MTTTEMTKDDVDDKMTIKRRLELPSGLSVIRLSASLLAERSSLSVGCSVLFLDVGATCLFGF